MAKESGKKNVVIRVSGGSLHARVPALILAAGGKASRRYFEFFTANIRNRNTREAYYRALADFFAWCDDRRLSLIDVEPIVVAAYIENLATVYSKPTVKQHLAAIRMCFDWLVVGQVLPVNPASSVRGPSYVVKRGKTPVLAADDARQLLDSIDTSTVTGLRDRALIGLMIYSFARVSAVVGMRVEDYYQNVKRAWIRLHEKGGKHHEVPAHHNAEAFLDSYIDAAGIGTEAHGPLFRTATGRSGILTQHPMTRHDVFRMVKRRARAAGLGARFCCHSFRAVSGR